MTAAPLQLAYDDLPPGSDVRREYDVDGVVRIVIPASDVPPAVRRAAAHRAVLWGAAIATPVLLASLGVFAYFVRANRIHGVPLAWAVAFFGIFCLAMAALIAWVRYGVLVETAQAARRQMTVLEAAPWGMRIETTGPFGVGSHDVPRARITGLNYGHGRVSDAFGRERRMTRLVVELSGRRNHVLLPGRDMTELRWTASTLARALHLAPPVNGDETRRLNRTKD